MQMNSTLLESEILPVVEKPSRYLGTELNTVHKDLRGIDLRICLAFPDSYDVGLGNLGLQILYHILNRDPRTWAERAFAPNVDMEGQLRRRGMPFFSMESRTPLSEFDAIGFTLQWELTYTNILNMLQMGGIPIFSNDRADDDPIILAGGPCVFNPEPLADFIDAFVVGDGEDVIVEVAEVLREGQSKGREWKLCRLAELKSVYVPALYTMRVADSGRLVMPDGGRTIVKRTVSSLDEQAFPADYIVPYTQQIHDRVSLEVLRGCTQGCRFCQAGMVTRPVRERSLPNLDHLMQEVIHRTGYEEISLSSLSTCDYSQVKSLVHQSVARGIGEGVSIGLPSLRLDSFSVELADMVSVMGKSGLTFAPEAATDRMRQVINKWIPDEELLGMAEEAYIRGWKHIKLYFMIGLPTEKDEDVEAIAGLANRVLDVGKGIRSTSKVNLGVSTFVPKPHTPFQWERQIDYDETERKQEMLLSLIKRDVKFGRHDPRESYIEGIISRSDRRAGKLIYEAFRLGARFDGWNEHIKWDAWQEAFRVWELDPDEQLKARKLNEPLPWDHIDVLVPKSYQKEEYWRSRMLVADGDCRHHKCNLCGVIDEEEKLCMTMLRNSRKGAKEEEGKEFEPLIRPEEPEPVSRVRMRFARRGNVRLLSHLEMMNMFVRALRRAQVPVAFTQGFSPGPRVAFSCALPLGFATEGDYMDVVLREIVSPVAIRTRLNAVLPTGFKILEATEIPYKATSLMSAIIGERYIAEIETDEWQAEEIVTAANTLTDREALWVEKTNKKGKLRRDNILPSVYEMSARQTSGAISVEMLLVKEDNIKASAKQVLESITPEIPPESWLVTKQECYVESEGDLMSPIDVHRRVTVG